MGFTRFSAFHCNEKGHRTYWFRFDVAGRLSYLLGMSETSPDELENAAPGKALPPAAQRALKEAAERRKRDAAPTRPTETNGPSGEEPTRFGDWERGGIAYDF